MTRRADVIDDAPDADIATHKLREGAATGWPTSRTRRLITIHFWR